MSDFWTAAARVRSGAGGDAALRPVSRFEIDPGFPVFEMAPPVADAVDVPVEAVPLLAAQASVQAVDDLIGSPAAPVVEQATDVPAATHEVVATGDAVCVVATDLPASAERIVHVERERIDVRVVREPAPPAPSRRATDQPRSIPAQIVVHEETVPEPSTVDDVSADIPAASSTVPVVTATPKTAEAMAVAASPPGPSTFSVPSPVAPVHVHIEHIDIRIDPPALPVAPRPTRRAVAPIDLNDYLARGGR